MIKKTNEPNAEQKVLETEEQLPCADSQITKSHSGKTLFALIVFLILVGGISYYLTPIFLPFLSKTPVVKEDQVISVVSKSDKLAPASDGSILEKNVVETETDNSAPTPAVILPDPTAKIEVASPEFQTDTNPTVSAINLNEADSILPKTEDKKTARQNDLLLDVVQLYETFQQNGQCRPLLEKLISLSELNPIVQNSINELLTICLENPLSEQIQTAFYKDKKRAILRILQKENTPIIAYLKMIPYTFLDIHKKGTFGNTPMDILYHIQNAVQANHFSKVLELIDQLPENVQLALYDLRQCAIHENTIYQILKDLLQTLAKGGTHG